ncbi:hypothetical protein [Nocardioides sp. InS609-2]|uniref:hypothetical protein n=1 Tax=Nocardioides sp. InS609-2 TaxID=2760705 RepID=UPI0020BEC13D|nr:hypothetical protein [Nocardioides sp. InS609-2]
MKPRGLRSISPVDWIGIVAGDVVLARLILRAQTEVWPWGFEVGEVVNDVAIAIVTACFFNWLVVERPRRRDLARIYGVMGESVLALGTVSLDIWAAFTETVDGQPDYETVPTADDWLRVCGELDFDTPLVGVWKFRADGDAGPALVREFLQDEFDRADLLLGRITPVLSGLPNELVTLIQKERGTRMRTVGVRRATRLYPSMADYHFDLAEYVHVGEEIIAYYEAHIRSADMLRPSGREV